MWDMIKAGYNGAKALFGFDESDIIKEGIDAYNESRKNKKSRSEELAETYASMGRSNFPGRVEVGVRRPDASTNIRAIDRGATSDAEIYSNKWTNIMRRAIIQAREVSPTLPITITSRKETTKTKGSSVNV
tara:strand:- start:4818 stop:5210 length:393 start_codon:yes stop_codon:yes gene_type:complete